MATILAHIRVREGAEERYEELSRSLYETTHAHEAGVRRFEIWRGSEPRTYYALLAFDDFTGFLAHQTSEHHEAAVPDLGTFLEGMRLEWVDPVNGASPLPATNGQPVPADADERTRWYAERLAAQVADWWQPLR